MLQFYKISHAIAILSSFKLGEFIPIFLKVWTFNMEEVNS